eukprot:6475942-Amphidinium_carterae.1
MIGGGFSSEPLSSTHATRWLKEILCAGGEALPDVAGISTHSLKCTLLSWAAKYGLDRETRQILGYHMVSGSRSALHYSRDEQASPLRHLLRVVNAVAYGNFHPDAGRSGMFKQFVPPVPPADEPASFSSDSSSSTSSSSEPDTDLEEALCKPRRPASSSGDVLVRHQRLQTVHRVRATDPEKLACGRSCLVGYVSCHNASVDWPRCKVCFGDVGSTGELDVQPSSAVKGSIGELDVLPSSAE